MSGEDPGPCKARLDEGWKREEWVETYLTGIRGGIPLVAEQIGAMLRIIDAARPVVESFLDLGCGDGVLASAVLERHPGASAALVDFSEPMLRAARSRFSGSGGNVSLIAADFGTPEWLGLVEPHAPFDAIVSGYAIHHQTDERKRALYGEIFRLLKPGGVFLNMEHVASLTPWIKDVAEALFSESLKAFQESRKSGEEFPAEELAERKDREANVLAPVERQCAWLRELGFSDVDCFFKVFELALFGGRRPG